MRMSKYKALIVEQLGERSKARVHLRDAAEVKESEVLIKVEYSSLNYKDALALSGRKGIMQYLPMVAGIDAAGVVVESAGKLFQEGDPVIVTGYGLSQSHDGGYAELLCVPEEWVVPLPDGLSLFESMALGTAGYTAALAIHRLQENKQTPEKGKILVTGATGGVGSFAINILASLDYQVAALSGKLDQQREYLQLLGASEFIDRLSIDLGHKSLEKGLWGGAIDCLGGEILSWLLRTVKPYGCVAACGLALGAQLETSVMPFIIRGVSLLGVASANSEMSIRQEIWQRLASDLKPRDLNKIVHGTLRLDEVVKTAEHMRASGLQGRYVVKLID